MTTWQSAVHRNTTRLVLLAFLAFGLGIWSTAQQATPAQADPSDPGPVILVLDTSGSMNDPSGSKADTKIDAAKTASLDLIGALAANTEFGMITYPGSASDCTNVGNVAVPLHALDIATASAKIREVTASGNTPTAGALQHAADLITEKYAAAPDNSTIVLVSDGESTDCSSPCAKAKQLRSSGLNVVVNTVGFQLSGDGEQELQCIADATGGRYTPANNPDALAKTMAEASGPALSATVQAPPTLPVVSGPGDRATDPSISVSIQNTGLLTATDVRVTISFVTPSGKVGSVLVRQPVAYLGTFVPGHQQPAVFDVIPRDTDIGTYTLTVTVTADQVPPVIKTSLITVTGMIQPSDLGGVLAGVEHLAILGDSYSSGEGTGINNPPGTSSPNHYINGTRGTAGQNACHRSTDNYGGDIWGHDAITIACSSAVTGNIMGFQDSGSERVASQLTQLQNLINSKTPPQAALMSIGGNDMGFADIAEQCITGIDCLGIPVPQLPAGTQIKTEDYYYQRAVQIYPDVKSALQNVDSVLNSPAAIRKRDGHLAPLIVIPYPRITPDPVSTSASERGCMLGLSTNELRFLNRLFDRLNSTIELAADNLSGSGQPVYLAKTVINSFQPSHTICDSKESFANTLQLMKGLNQTITTNYTQYLHPNSAGHEAMARAIVGWSQQSGRLPDPARLPKLQIPNYYDQPSKQITKAKSSFLDGLASSLRIFAATPNVRSGGFTAGSSVVVQLHSEPTTIGVLRADRDGMVDGDVWIPDDTPIGQHTLEVVGISPHGSVIDQAKSLRILPWGGRPLLVTGPSARCS